MQECAALVLNAIRSTPIKAGHVFTIADYGCADGGTSMPLWYACVKELKEKHGSEFPIHVMYDDQPVNDFKSLFLRLQGELAPQLLCYGKLKHHIIERVVNPTPSPPSPSLQHSISFSSAVHSQLSGWGRRLSANYILHCVREQ